MSSRVKAYPWSEDKGLCKVLGVPSLWGPSFPAFKDRHVIKSAAKRTPALRNLSQVKVFNVADNEAFGSIVIELLASPVGRKELDKEIAKRFDNLRLNTFIAKHLYDHHLAQYEGEIPRTDEICDNRQAKGWQFVPANLLSWLGRKERSPEDLQVLSLYACYFALRWPDQAEAIRKVLVNHDPAFLNWLSDEEVAPESPPTQTPQPLPEPTKANAQAEPQSITTPVIVPEVVPDEKPLLPLITDLPADSAELVHLLTMYSDWNRKMSVDQLCSAVDLLKRKAENHADRLREFDEIRGRITNYLKEIAQIPWLEGSFSVNSYLSLPSDISVEGALERFATVEQEAASFLQMHLRLETLIFRLGSESPPLIVYKS